MTPRTEIAMILLAGAVAAVSSFFLTIHFSGRGTQTASSSAKSAVREYAPIAVRIMNECVDKNGASACAQSAERLIESVSKAESGEIDQVVKSKANIYIFHQSAIAFVAEGCSGGFLDSDLIVVNVYPQVRTDLPKESLKSGFEVLGFKPSDRGVKVGNVCVASQNLPSYPLARILVGQYNRAGNKPGFVWKEMLAVGG